MKLSISIVNIVTHSNSIIHLCICGYVFILCVYCRHTVHSTHTYTRVRVCVYAVVVLLGCNCFYALLVSAQCAGHTRSDSSSGVRLPRLHGFNMTLCTIYWHFALYTDILHYILTLCTIYWHFVLYTYSFHYILTLCNIYLHSALYIDTATMLIIPFILFTVL